MSVRCRPLSCGWVNQLETGYPILGGKGFPAMVKDTIAARGWSGENMSADNTRDIELSAKSGDEKVQTMTVVRRPCSLARATKPCQQTGWRRRHAHIRRS